MKIRFCIFLFFVTALPAPAQINIDTLAYDNVKKDLQLNAENGMVIIGEAHNVKNTFLTEYFIIKDLTGKGYKNIFIEGGKSEAAIYNMYFSSGDTSILRYTRAVSENKEFRQFIELLYKLNKENNTGITFHGFDFERATCVNFLFKRWFANVITKDAGMNKNIETLFSINDNGDRTYKRINENSAALKNAFTFIKSSFDKYEQQYKDILKENYSTFRSIIFNPSFFKTTGDKQRDRNMADAMLSYESENESALNKSIIITGTFHIIDNKERFIPLFLKEKVYAYKATLFISVYKNCMMIDGERKFKYNSEFSLLRLLKEQPLQPVIKFYLTSELGPVPPSTINAAVLIGFYDQ